MNPSPVLPRLRRCQLPAQAALAALATLAATAHTGAAAQSTLTMFGVMDLAVRRTQVAGESAVHSLASGGVAGSRIGLRGQEDLGGGLSASFWLEGDIAADTGAVTATAFWSRRSTASLAHERVGELRAGRDYVPLFSRQYVPLSPFGVNGLASTGGMFFGTPALLGSGSGAGVRADNMIKLVLPDTLGGVFGEAMVSAAEGRTSNRHRGAVVGWAAGLTQVSAGFGHTMDAAGQSSIKLSTLGGAYDAGVVRVAGLWQQARYLQRRQLTWDLNLTVPLGLTTLKAGISKADQSGAGTDANDAQQLSLGMTYALSRRSNLYATYSRIDNRGKQSFGMGGVTPAAGRDMQGLETGFTHRF